MSDESQRKPSWAAVKRAFSALDQNAVLQLVQELYELSSTNKDLFHARLHLGGDPIQKYRQIIDKCMYPNADRGHPIQIAKAKKAIGEYRKAVGDPRGQIDLMLHFVERGNQFTLDYGDINGPFYDSLISMYEQAAEAVLDLPDGERQPFRKRLEDLLDASDGMGWGYHDSLCDIYAGTILENDA
jgi:hypothetical protein